MTEDRSDSQEPHGLLGALLSPLRAPQRVFGDIETIAVALLALQRDARDRLGSIDDRAAELIKGVAGLHEPVNRLDRNVESMQSLEGTITASMEALQAPLDRLEGKVDDLQSLEGVITEKMDNLQAPLDGLDVKVGRLHTLEETITERMNAIDDDLNSRMLAVEQEVHAMRAPLEQISRDVQSVVKLLPDPNDGPLTRLKDTFTSS